MSKTRGPRYPVVIRDGKLYVEGRKLVFWGNSKMVNGRIQSCGHDFSPGCVHPIGFADDPEKFKLQMCRSCNALFVGYWEASYCGHCMDITAARAKERAKTANAERAAERRAKRAEAKCAACGKPLVGRQRGGERPAYCSNACRQWTYRRRKQGIGEPQASTGGIPFMITADAKRRLREIGRTEDDIFNMTPAEAHRLLNAATAAADKAKGGHRAREGLAELDRLQQPASDAGVVIEGRIIGDAIVIEAEPGAKA